MGHYGIEKRILKIILWIGLFLLIGLINTEEVDAQSCGYWNWSCSPNPYGCSINTNGNYKTVGCSPGGPCPDGFSGNKCNHGGYNVTQYNCQHNGSYYCKVYNTSIGAGFCGCNPNSGDGDGDTGTTPPPVCDCNLCGTGQCGNSNTGDCIQDSTCGLDGGGQPLWWCPTEPSCCSTQCPSNTCEDCQCVAPAAAQILVPAQNQVFNPSTDSIVWSIPESWGVNGGTFGTNNCSGCSYQGGGNFKVYANNVDITSWCVQASGGEIADSINTCRLTQTNSAWIGNSVTFRLVTNNGCSTAQSQTTVNLPPNTRPSCTALNVATGGTVKTVAPGGNANLTTKQLATDIDEPFTMTYTTQDSDGYGDPTNIELCYAARSQTNAFYQGGQAAYRCMSAIAGGPTMPNTVFNRSGNTLTVTTTLREMIANYSQSQYNYVGVIEDIGFVFTLNVFDNISNNSFCSGNMGYNNGNGIWWENWANTGAACNVSACKLEAYNAPPDIRAQSNSGQFIGKPGATGLQCSSNNPHEFKATISDGTGAQDVDRVQFELAKPQHVVAGNIGNNAYKFPVRIMFAKEFKAYPQQFSNGTSGIFFVRDMNVESVNVATPTSRKCYSATRALIDFDPTGWDASNPNRSRTARNTADTMWCYGYDSHTWRNAGTATNVSGFDGISERVNIHYLTADITVYNEGYEYRLKGSSNFNNASYVAYATNSDNVYTNFKVEFLDNPGHRWDGQMRKLWFTSDRQQAQDKTVNLPAEELKIANGNQYFHAFSSVIFDMEEPTVTLAAPTVLNATQLSLAWSADDNGGSGLDRVYGEAKHSNNGASPIKDVTADNANDPQVPPYGNNQANWYQLISSFDYSAPHLWNRDPGAPVGTLSRTDTIDIGENEQGTLSFEAVAIDMACNSTSDEESRTLYEPWILSRGGTVYSQGSINNSLVTYADNLNNTISSISPSTEFETYPYKILRGDALLSTELMSSGQVIAPSQLGSSSAQNRVKAPTVGNYTDNNNQPGRWFTELTESYQKEKAKDGAKFTELTTAGSRTIRGNISTLCPNNNKICVISASAVNFNLNGSTPVICDRRTLIISAGNVRIDTDILASGADSGCIILSGGNITIEDGAYFTGGLSYPRYDRVEAFMIAEGQIQIKDVDQTQTSRDGLKIRGGVVAFGNGTEDKSIVLGRSLKLLDNQQYPAAVFVHDPRYLYIAKSTFGGESNTYKSEVGFK